MRRLETIRSGFNRLASVYDLLASVFSFGYIQRSQNWLLTQKATPYSNALIFGGGTGVFLYEMIKNTTAQNYCYVDISDKMIEAAQNKISQHSHNHVQFICGSYTDIPSTNKFDLVVTNYILDCFTEEELPLVLNSLQQHLTPKATWFFVDFSIPKAPASKLFSISILRLLYTFFNAVCGLGVKQLPDFKSAFSRLNLELVTEQYFFCGLLVARIYKSKN